MLILAVNNIPMRVPSQTPLIRGLLWLSERKSYPEAGVTGDTYAMTWADDDAIYASSGDPMWGGCRQDTGLDVEKFHGDAPDYQITRPSLLPDFLGYGGDGPKPSGMICVEGKLYLAIQHVLGPKKPRHGEKCQHGQDASILVSENHGEHWAPAFKDIATPMFPGSLFGGPAFINFGKNNAYARDDYVYAVSADQWDNGSEIRTGRVPKDKILNAGAWEWVSRVDNAGNADWTGDLAASVPVLVRDRAISLPDMVYLKKLNRYVLLTWRLHQDFGSDSGTDLYIYESPQPWGPFTLVHQEASWETQAVTPYCPRLPLKWMASDGLTGWLQFSGSWTSPHDRERLRPYYRSNIRQFRFITM